MLQHILIKMNFVTRLCPRYVDKAEFLDIAQHLLLPWNNPE